MYKKPRGSKFRGHDASSCPRNLKTQDTLSLVLALTYPEENGTRLALTYDYDASDLYDQNASYGINVVDTGGIKTQSGDLSLQL
jgi:hypothetical protein